jgi:phosphoketolase
MSSNPHANGGLLLRDLALPDFRDYAVEVSKPGDSVSEATRVLGSWLRDIITANPSTFRLFGPDETASNRLGNFEVTDRAFDGQIIPGDDHLAPDGRVMEVLSEHMCQGWLEGYLLTGRHGLFNRYEAFIHIIDSMFNQHAKWLKVTRDILDRFHLVMDVIDRVPGLSATAGHVRQLMVDKRISCRAYTRAEGEDAPEITGWQWTSLSSTPDPAH